MKGGTSAPWALLLWTHLVLGSTVFQAASVTRHHEGDTFLLRRDGTAASCSRTLCSDSHAGPTQAGPKCACRCPPELPVFREDLHVCVDDVHECALATFKNGAKLQKIPFVFLPMKGQIIHPSSDIIFPDDKIGDSESDDQPVCVVSSAQFLTRSGWIELRNASDTEPPLRLFRDHRRTFLQWLGEQDLRLGMEGRVLIARLMCKDPSGIPTSSSSGVITHAFSTPCVAFRVAGSQGAREVVFTSDYSVAGSGGLLHGLLGGGSDQRPSGGGLTALEGVAVGLCVLLLGLVYAASVCVYLHVRRRRRKKKKKRGHLEDSISDSDRGGGGHHMGHTDIELLSEGVVKNNPLLLNRDVQAYSSRGMLHSSSRSRTLRACSELPQVAAGGTSEDEEEDTCEASSSDRSGHSEDNRNQHTVVTCTKALVHPVRHKLGPAPPIPSNKSSEAGVGMQNGSTGVYTLTLQPSTEGGSMERHPEESVSIVETLDDDAGIARARDLAFLGARHASVNSGMSINSDGSGRGSVSSCPAQGNPFLTAPGTGTRRKLYFNPAYFETEMLHAPPPAALEFLQKLREVITMSKHKMATKRFSPCLVGIPEEHDSICSSSKNGEKSENTQRSWAGSHTRRQPEQETNNVHLPDDMTGGKQHTIRRWLEDLQSGDPIEEESIENNPRESPKPPQIPSPPPLPAPTRTPPQRKLMDAVIKELVRERGMTPADSTSDDTTQSEIRTTGSMENDYETITMHDTSSASPQPTSSAPSSPISRPPLMMYGLPELLAKTNGYNLVSEVYVNDGYSSNQSSVSRSSTKKLNQRPRPTQGSAGSSSEPSSQSSSLSENLESGEDQESNNYPGRLTIQLADEPLFAERVTCESEEFEPDTLDRGKKIPVKQVKKPDNMCMDSLERPMKILLKSSGSFYHDAVMNETHANKNSWLPSERIWEYPNVKEKKKKSPSSIADLRSANIAVLPGLHRNSACGSLREIFEAKRQQQLRKQIEEIETVWMPQLQEIAKRGATRSLVEPNEVRWRSGFSQQMVDEIRELMWKSTPEAGTPLPRVPHNKPRRQRSADIAAQPPTPPPSVPPSNPPTLPPKQRKCNSHQPPPSLPPKNLRGSRSPSNHHNNRLPNLVTSHQVPPSGASAVSDDYDEDDEQLQGGSCTLGRKVENCISDAFSTWGKHNNRQRSWEPEVKLLHRPGDSGYLSSDSNNSLKREESRKLESSETEESCDGESESGAESVGTDSFFFGRARPQDTPLAIPLSRYVTSDFTPGTTVVHMPPLPTVHIQATKKKPPPPPKRINSRLETIRNAPANNNNSLVRKLASQYAL